MMSNKAITWARDIPVGGNAKLVLLILADHANEEKDECWPGINRVAQIGGISRSSVIRQIKKLTKLGWMSKEMRKTEQGRTTSNMYRLNLALKPESILSDAGGGCHPDTPGYHHATHEGVTMLPTRVSPCYPNPNKEPKEEPICKVATSSSIKNIFEHWQKIFHHPNAKLDGKRKSTIKNALKLGYSEDELKTAIEGCAKTPYNMGENDSNQRYDAITLILRDAEHIERYMQNCKNPPKSKSISVANDPMRGAI